MKQVRAIIRGKVQGVWFRGWTRDTARELGLRGWVRNLPDGAVEAVALGKPDSLGLFLERLHNGPPLARVFEVETRWEEPDSDSDTFRIRR